MDSAISFARVKRFPAIIWVMLLGNFFVRGTYYMVWPFLSVILYKKFGLSATEVGLLLTTAVFSSVLVGMYAGNLSDRLGRKPVMLAATVIGLLAFAALSFVQSLPMFIGAIFLATLPRSLWDSPSKALLGDVLTDSKDREMALQSLYFITNVGAATGPLIGIWIGLTGEQSSFIYTSIAYIGLSIAIAMVFTQASGISNKQIKNEVNFRQTLRLLATDQVFLLVILANILVMFIYAHGDTSLFQYLVRADVSGLVELISSIVILNSLVIVCFQFPLLKLMENIELQTRINIGVVLLAISQLIFAYNPIDFYAGWLIATFVLSVAEAILFANMNVHIDRLAPSHMRGSYFGAASLYSLGFASAPVLGGLILDHWGGPALFISGFALSLLVIVMYYATRYLKRPDFVTSEIDPVGVS